MQCQIKNQVFSYFYFRFLSSNINFLTLLTSIEKQILRTFPFHVIINHVYVFIQNHLLQPLFITHKTVNNRSLTSTSLSNRYPINHTSLQKLLRGKDSSLKIPITKASKQIVRQFHRYQFSFIK